MMASTIFLQPSFDSGAGIGGLPSSFAHRTERIAEVVELRVRFDRRLALADEASDQRLLSLDALFEVFLVKLFGDPGHRTQSQCHPPRAQVQRVPFVPVPDES
jgi:hypothetical protein